MLERVDCQPDIIEIPYGEIGNQGRCISLNGCVQMWTTPSNDSSHGPNLSWCHWTLVMVDSGCYTQTQYLYLMIFGLKSACVGSKVTRFGTKVEPSVALFFFSCTMRRIWHTTPQLALHINTCIQVVPNAALTFLQNISIDSAGAGRCIQWKSFAKTHSRSKGVTKSDKSYVERLPCIAWDQACQPSSNLRSCISRTATQIEMNPSTTYW
jgi:hypothetical protein